MYIAHIQLHETVLVECVFKLSPFIVCSTMFDVDEKRDEWQEEIYENQARYPLSSWPDESKSYWNNVVGCITYCCIEYTDMYNAFHSYCVCVCVLDWRPNQGV